MNASPSVPYTSMGWQELETERLRLVELREGLPEGRPGFSALTLELDEVIRLQYTADITQLEGPSAAARWMATQQAPAGDDHTGGERS